MKGESSLEENILYSINEQATKFYQDQLSKLEQAQNYLKQRNINEESIKNFKIGFSGTEDELFNYLIQKGYTTEQIESTKLCVKNVKPATKLISHLYLYIIYILCKPVKIKLLCISVTYQCHFDKLDINLNKTWS